MSILVILAVLVGGYFYFAGVQYKSPEEAIGVPDRLPDQSPPPTRNFVIPHGRQTYVISGVFNSPEIYEATIDPVDVHVGDTQTMEVKVKDSDFLIDRVIAEVETDTGVKNYTLTLKTDDSSDGIWEGSWIVHDTHDEVYHTTYRAVNSEGEESEVTLTWTDPCAPPPSGDWTLLGVCNTGAGVITGADGDGTNGDIYLNGNTVTIDAGSTFVWNSGRTIFIEGGSIALNTTAQIKKTNLWMIDNDSDGRPSSATMIAQDGIPSSSGYMITFTDTSTDSDGSISSWAWKFGDGGKSVKQNPTYVYAQAGTYTVVLTVTDDDGATDTSQQQITVP